MVEVIGSGKLVGILGLTGLMFGAAGCQQTTELSGAAGSTGTSQVGTATTAFVPVAQPRTLQSTAFLKPAPYKGMWHLTVAEKAQECLINLTDVKSDSGFYHVQTFGCPDGFGRIQQWGAYENGLVVADAAGQTMVEFKGSGVAYAGRLNSADGQNATVNLQKQ